MWPFSPKPQVLSFPTATCSEVGLVRPENQDHVLALPSARCFAVADGMGGGQGGALASEWILEPIRAVFTRSNPYPFKDLPDVIEKVIFACNERIRVYTKAQHFKMMGTTLAMLFIKEDGAAQICHVGDSRVYRLRGENLILLTRDHTIGNELGRLATSRADLTLAQEVSNRKNPLSHVLTRVIGVEKIVKPEWQAFSVERGDRYLLCTDGVHDMLSDAEIAVAIKRSKTMAEAAEYLKEGIIKAGAGDNFSFVLLEVK